MQRKIRDSVRLTAGGMVRDSDGRKRKEKNQSLIPTK